MSGFVQQQLQSFGQDYLMDKYNDYAGDHFNTIDPFQDEDGNKRRLTKDITTKEEQKLWKNIQLKAWVHDKCFMGSCGVGMDCGLGAAPLVVLLLPGLGPLLMYAVHLRLVQIAEEQIQLPSKLQAKLHSNIIFSLIITFPPVIGSFFGWLHGCSTRNASLIYQYIEFQAKERAQNKSATYVGAGSETRGLQQREFGSDVTRAQPPMTNPPGRAYTAPGRKPPTTYQTRKGGATYPQSGRNNRIVVQDQQQSGFV